MYVYKYVYRLMQMMYAGRSLCTTIMEIVYLHTYDDYNIIYPHDSDEWSPSQKSLFISGAKTTNETYVCRARRNRYDIIILQVCVVYYCADRIHNNVASLCSDRDFSLSPRTAIWRVLTVHYSSSSSCRSSVLLAMSVGLCDKKSAQQCSRRERVRVFLGCFFFFFFNHSEIEIEFLYENDSTYGNNIYYVLCNIAVGKPTFTVAFALGSACVWLKPLNAHPTYNGPCTWYRFCTCILSYCIVIDFNLV